jgi:hypothetical protein
VDRPSITPKKRLRRAVPDAVLFSSERLVMEEMDYDLLFRWFVG